VVRDLLREVFGKATRSPSPSSQPQVITAEGPAVKEVRVPRPAPVIPKELTDRLMALDDHLTALEERMSEFEASLERVVEAIDGQDRALMDEISRLREELNMVRREYEKIQQLQQAMGLSP
jgi:predicted RNase H-like nuclease (RuvC/YqgF family)